MRCTPYEASAGLRRLGLLPKALNGRAAGCGVAATDRPRRPAAAPTGGTGNRKRTTARADLAKLLEPSLETHHAKLRKELLAEFAILERREERMRHDLFLRVDARARRTAEQLEQVFSEDRDAQRLSGRLQVFALAAVFIAGFGLSLAMTWNMNSKLEQRIAEQETAFPILEVNAWERSAAQTAPADAPTLASHPHAAVNEYTMAAPADTPSSYAESEPGVAALVSELQAMGILGPVRIETIAGSFCVKATGSGYRIEGANVALRDCESLPVRLSMRGP